MLIHYNSEYDRVGDYKILVKDMTYILAGKNANTTFIQSDCIVKHGDVSFFKNKLIKLQSIEDTYFTCCGSEYFSIAIQYLDLEKDFTNAKIDINSSSFNDEFMDFYFSLTDAVFKSTDNIINEGRLFFINNKDVFYFDIVIESRVFKKYKITKHQLENNEYITSYINNQKKGFEDENYQVLIDKWFGQFNEDFKNRFTSLYYENDKAIIKSPYLYKEDFIFEFMGYNKEYKYLK
jgi:hypothetical protein